MEENDKKIKGRIFDIQRFSIHDGPGIRTIVFLKGCSLRCKWCCNPESQEYQIQTMIVGGKPEVIGEDITVEEVMDEVKKDLPYYRRSGGGLTLSGGESLCQPEFASGLLRASKLYGINTAMESTGNAEFSIIQKLLPYLDLYLMDIKHMDSKKHKEFTGKSNELILENAVKIAKSKVKLIIRVPVIPTFNHTKKEILDIAAFAKSLPGVKELHLLPYHRLGQDKYVGLGREYQMAHIKPIEQVYLNELLETAKTTGLKCQIGG